jgi:hypothetical protein
MNATSAQPETARRPPTAMVPTLPSEDVVYIHLCRGEIREVRPATGVRLDARELVVVCGEAEVARFALKDVYFATRQPGPPPVMF